MSYFVQFLLIVLLQSLASGKVTIQSTLSRRHIKTSQDSIFYNGIFFTVVALILAVFFPKAPLSAGTLLLGAASGMLTLMFQVFYSIALSSGPISITVLIINFNIIIPTVISAVVYHENVYVSQLFGIILLILSMILSTKEDASGAEKKMTKLWFITAITACLSTAFSTVIMNFFAKTDASTIKNSSNTFLIVMYFCAALFTFLLYFIKSHTGKRQHFTFRLGKSIYLYALGMGIFLALFQKLNVYCMANIDGSFLFPTQSGTSAVMMTAIGIAVFKDKLSRRQMIGVICGILCVVFMNMRFGTYFTL